MMKNILLFLISSIVFSGCDNLSQVYNKMGYRKYIQGDHQRAIEYFTKSIKFDENTENYYNRGIAKFALHDFTGAIADYNKAIDISPGNEDCYINRGNAKFALQDFSGSIEDYTNAIKINPESIQLYFNVGLAKSRLEDYEGAIDYFTLVIDRYQNLQVFIADSTESTELFPIEDTYHLRGLARFAIQDYNGAIADYTMAIEIYPKFPGAYYKRGEANIKIGEKDKGCLDFSKAGELGDKDAYDAINKYCLELK